MSKKPYVVQEDSPNLVIVPIDNIDTIYEPSPNKVKESDTPLPKPATSISCGNVFVRKTSAKLNSSRRNNDVLIDVRKIQKSPTSWATNFLQSIGGSSTKFDRIYSTSPKSTSLLKNSITELEKNNKRTILPNTIQIRHHQTNTPQIMEKKTSQPKINLNLIKSVPQPTMTKEASKPNTIHYTSTSTQVCKEPSLPKNYKIPMQSKPNKLVAQAVMDKNTAKPNSSNNLQNSITSKIQTLSSSSNSDKIAQSNHHKIATSSITTNKETAHSNKNKEPNNLNNSQNRKKKDNTQVKVNNNTEQLVYGNEIKPKKIEHIDKFHTTKHDELTPTKYKETTHIVNNKENSQPKYSKDINQRKSIKETLQRGSSTRLSKSTNENTSLAKNEEIIAHIKTIKELYKLKNKHAPTYSTKLQTKKERIALISSKIAKNSQSKDNESQDTRSNKYKDKSVTKKESNLPQTLFKKEDNIAKLKKKRATDKKSDQAECSGSKHKKPKLSSPDNNAAKNETSKSFKEERLSKSISPIKSVVSRIKADHQFHSTEKLYHKDSGYYNSHYEKSSCTKRDYHCQNLEQHLQRGSDVDLRTKLKRKIPKNDYKKEDYKWSHANRRGFVTVPNGEPFVPEENLIISFNADDDNNKEKVTKKKSPVKKLARKRPPKDKKCKKIKLEINIVFGHGDDTTDEESTKSEVETNVEAMESMDLSFLDDFNVDEIVESLNECKDCPSKTNGKEETVVDGNLQDSMSNDIKNIEAMGNKDSVLLNINGRTCTDISSVESKIDNHQSTALKLTVNESRPKEILKIMNSDTCSVQEFRHLAVIDDINTNQDLKNQIKIDTSQNSQNTGVRALSTELYMEKLNSESFTDSDHHSNIPTDTPQETGTRNMCVDSDIKINNNISITQLQNNSEVVVMTHTENSSQVVAKLEHLDTAEIIDDAVNNKPRLASSEMPEVMSSSETNVYSDHNDLIDALQDNSNLEINAIKSFIASQNNNTDAIIKKTKNEMPSTVREYSTVNKSGISNQNKTEILTCIKEDPDIILIDDSDGENETEIKNNQYVKDKNGKDIQTVKESPLDKSDEVILFEPTDENSESTLILDTTEKDIQQDISADEVIIVEPTGANTEPVLILDTDYDFEDSDKTRHLNGSNHIRSQEPSKPKTETTSIEIKTDTIAEVRIESKKTVIQNQVTNKIQSEKIQTEANNGKDEKDNLANAPKIGKIEPKSSEQHFSVKPTDTEVVPSTTKTVAMNTKTQNVTTKLETKAHNEDIPQSKSGNKENAPNHCENQVERSSSLNNNKFIRALESKLYLIMREKWTVTDVIHTGKFSKIYSCKDSFKQDYAIKTLKKVFNGYNLGLQKENMMMELQNGVPENNLNCVRLITGFLSCGLWCFLMEYYPMNLLQALEKNKRSFHIDVVQILSRQLVSAVTILRNNNIIHSDIKPSHILINSSQTRIKLCGFDQASYSQHSVMLPNTGSVNYRAPELILGYPAGYGIDVWSTALVMYEMSTNRQLFPGLFNNNILYQQICTLGPIPMEMLMDSQFRYTHFSGTAFIKIIGSNEKIIINEIEFNRRINNTLHQAYATDWEKEKQHAKKREDKSKLRAFSELLHSMLAMHPRCRIAIEFVFANPFIYESFDDC